MRHAALSLIALVTFGSGSAWGAQSTGGMFLAGGGSYFNKASRDVTQNDWGVWAALGVSDAKQFGMVGAPSVEIDVRQAAGAGNRLQSVMFSYTERVPLSSSEGIYLGAGFGSTWGQVKITSPESAATSSSRWGVGAKAVLGLSMRGSMAMEAGYLYTQEIAGFRTDGMVGGLVIHF